MDEEKAKPMTGTTPASFLTSPSQERSQKWQALNLHKDHELAKKMFKASLVLIPPLPKTQEEHRQQFKKTYSDQKRRLRAIFKRIIAENSSRIAAFNICPNQRNSRHLRQEECSTYFGLLHDCYLSKLHQMKHNSEDLLEDSHFFLLDASLDEIDKWIKGVEKIVMRIYENFVNQRLNLIAQLQSLKTPKPSPNKTQAFNQPKNSEITMNQLESQLGKLMISDLDPEKDIKLVDKELEREKRAQMNKGSRSDSEGDD